jgi:hypothetical protein
MSEHVTKGTWVEIYSIILDADERAAQVPEDTQHVPLEMKVKGFLKEDATVGEEAKVVTPAGRTLSGTLTQVNPEYAHQFGRPIPELATIGKELREILYGE